MNSDPLAFSETAAERRRWTWWAVVLIAVPALYRLWYVTQFDVTHDEAHYWLWSRPEHLDLSYYSKPPLVAWAIALGTTLLGDTALGVRALASLLGAGTLAGLFLFGRRLFSARIGFWAAVLGSVVPMFAAGSVIMSIDPLSMFFWVLALAAFWRVKDEPGPGGWLLTGLWVGLGALSKYTNLAQLASFALFCLWARDYRHLFRTGRFWAMVLTVMAVFSPVLIWNAQHDWITVTHVKESGDLDQPFELSLASLGEWIGGQMGLLTPVLFAGLVGAWWALPRAARTRPLVRYAYALFLPLFAAYTLLSLNKPSNPNWAVLSYAGLIVLAPAAWARLLAGHAWLRGLAGLGVGMGAALAVAVLGLIPLLRALPDDDPWLNRRIASAPLNRVLGIETLVAEAARQAEAQGATFFISTDRGVASQLSFYLPGHPRTFLPAHSGVQNQFSFWPQYPALHRGESAILVTLFAEPDPAVVAGFREVVFLREFWSQWDGRNVRRYRLFLARECLGPPP